MTVMLPPWVAQGVSLPPAPQRRTERRYDGRMGEKVVGDCHICGRNGDLSYEHVPPRSAFNNRRIWVARGDQLFRGRDIDSMSKDQLQRGAGGYTLCARCNNDTGRWYGAAFAAWAAQAVEILERAKEPPLLAYPYTIYPLRLIKQIISMFFSVNAPVFRNEVPYLVRFVLNRYTKGLPDDIRLHAAYTAGRTSRTAGKSGLITGVGGNDMRAHAISEVAFPPFVFVLTLGSDCPDPRLVDISFFASFGYDEMSRPYMNFPVLPINSPYPTDYRTTSEIRRAAAYATKDTRALEI